MTRHLKNNLMLQVPEISVWLAGSIAMGLWQDRTLGQWRRNVSAEVPYLVAARKKGPRTRHSLQRHASSI